MKPVSRASLQTLVKTPCIGVCSTGIGDLVCRGCKRFEHEVIGWNGYSQEERRAVLARIDVLLEQIVTRWLPVNDPVQLGQQLALQQVGFDPARAPTSWVVELLKAGASQIEDPAVFGLQRTGLSEGLTLRELRDQIDAEFYALSCAHFDRYFKP
jgi:predicted Fe-S protein YdhL (DUF1289 family)